MVVGCGAEVTAPGEEPTSAFRPSMSAVAGTWNYRADLITEAGCWPTGPSEQTCILNSSLVRITGTIILTPSDTTGVTATFLAHHDLDGQIWYNSNGDCDDQPVACYTATPPSASWSWAGDTLATIFGGHPDSANLFIRRIPQIAHVPVLWEDEQWAWWFTDTTPTAFYDSAHYAIPFPVLGVHEMIKSGT